MTFTTVRLDDARSLFYHCSSPGWSDGLRLKTLHTLDMAHSFSASASSAHELITTRGDYLYLDLVDRIISPFSTMFKSS